MSDIILTIAGFDPSSGAGITADLAVIAAHGLFGTSCITALTVQSTVGVKRWQAAGAQLVADTLDCLQADLPPAGVKVGMLADRATLEAVAQFLARLPPGVPVVLDPVIRSSSGRNLLDEDAVSAMQNLLLRYVHWVTPNLSELAILAGHASVASRQQMEEATAALQSRFPHLGVVATGGHLDEPDDLVAAPELEPAWLQGRHIETRATHGTGCAFSTALVCNLVRGLEPLKAAATAKDFVAQAMQRAKPRGAGRGPMNLTWPLRSDL